MEKFENEKIRYKVMHRRNLSTCSVLVLTSNATPIRIICRTLIASARFSMLLGRFRYHFTDDSAETVDVVLVLASKSRGDYRAIVHPSLQFEVISCVGVVNE